MIYPGDVYRDFEKWIDDLKIKIINNISFHEYFSPEDMISRALQIFTFLTNEDYSLSQRKNNIHSTKKYGPFIIKRGSIRLSLKSRIIYNAIFFLESGYFLLQIFNGLFSFKKKKKGVYTVLIEPPIIGTSNNLKTFLKHTKIFELNNTDFLIIKKRVLPQNATSELIFKASPWNYIIDSNFSVFVRLFIALKFILFTFLSFFYLNKSPLNILFYRDLPIAFSVHLLNRNNLLKNIFITNSSYLVQPLWLKGLKNANFKSSMIWYSQNFIPKFYRGESEQSYLPGTNKIRIDHHWVWTKKFGEMLKRKNPSCSYTAIGSILFYPFAIKPKILREYIVIFDVIPRKSQEKLFFGAIYNYYSVETIKAFVYDIVTTIDEINNTYNKQIEVILKTKRPKNNFHSDEYFQFTEKLKLKYPIFKMVDSQLNIYGLIKGSKAVFSVPFTSTAEVGFEMKIPSFFYDASNKINVNKETEHMPMLFNKEEIKSVILGSINCSNE
jgi:polysaccharide biosynthesis PFTS motif protein